MVPQLPSSQWPVLRAYVADSLCLSWRQLTVSFSKRSFTASDTKHSCFMVCNKHDPLSCCQIASAELLLLFSLLCRSWTSSLLHAARACGTAEEAISDCFAGRRSAEPITVPVKILLHAAEDSPGAHSVQKLTAAEQLLRISAILDTA